MAQLKDCIQCFCVLFSSINVAESEISSRKNFIFAMLLCEVDIIFYKLMCVKHFCGQ